MPAPKDPKKREEWKRKLSESHKGGEPSNKGKSMPQEIRTRLVSSDSKLGNGRIWTDEEETILQEMYFTQSATELHQIIPRHSVAAITLKAAYMGLTKKRPLEPVGHEYKPASDLFLPGDNERECTQCGMIKPYNQFFKYKNGLNGHHSVCRPCYMKKYKSNNKLRLQQSKKQSPERLSDGYKRCARCKEIKSFEDFHRDKSSKDGCASRCRICSRTSQNENRTQNLKTLYGLTIEEYNAMLDDQNGVCAICGKSGGSMRGGEIMPLFVDHCHTTDAIRGLLCHNCNAALGMLYEDPDRIKALLKYVEERCLW